MARFQALIEQQGWGFGALEEKTLGHFIGFVGLNSVAADMPFAPNIEVAWRIDRAYCDQGDTCNGAIRYGEYPAKSCPPFTLTSQPSQ